MVVFHPLNLSRSGFLEVNFGLGSWSSRDARVLGSRYRAFQSPHVAITVLTRADKERESLESQDTAGSEHLELMLAAGVQLVLLDLELLDSG